MTRTKGRRRPERRFGWQEASKLRWPGSIDECLQASVAGFVAQPAPAAESWVEDSLHALRDALNSGRLSAVTLIFGGMFQVQLRKSDNWKVWRKQSELFGEQQ